MSVESNLLHLASVLTANTVCLFTKGLLCAKHCAFFIFIFQNIQMKPLQYPVKFKVDFIMVPHFTDGKIEVHMVKFTCHRSHSWSVTMLDLNSDQLNSKVQALNYNAHGLHHWSWVLELGVMELTRLVSESPAVTLKGWFLLAASASPDKLTEKQILRPCPSTTPGWRLQSVFHSFPRDSDASVNERATVLANYSHPWLLCHGIWGPERPCWSLIPASLELDITHLVCFLVLFSYTRSQNQVKWESFAGRLRVAGPSVVWIAELWHVSVPLTVKGQVLQSPRFPFTVSPPLIDDPGRGASLTSQRLLLLPNKQGKGIFLSFSAKAPEKPIKSSIHLYLTLNLTSFPTK